MYLQRDERLSKGTRIPYGAPGSTRPISSVAWIKPEWEGGGGLRVSRFDPKEISKGEGEGSGGVNRSETNRQIAPETNTLPPEPVVARVPNELMTKSHIVFPPQPHTLLPWTRTHTSSTRARGTRPTERNRARRL